MARKRIVSVHLPRETFALIAEAAERQGASTPAFLHDAALARVRGVAPFVRWSGAVDQPNPTETGMSCPTTITLRGEHGDVFCAMST